MMKMNGILGRIGIFLLMIVTAFIGYVPPWGQMSFWGATVITSLASAIPVVGDTIVTWLWGGFSVDNATLNRFFSLHHLLPLILVGASLLHLSALHQYGSNNPLGVHSEMDKIASYPYFYVIRSMGEKKVTSGRARTSLSTSTQPRFGPILRIRGINKAFMRHHTFNRQGPARRSTGSFSKLSFYPRGNRPRCVGVSVLINSSPLILPGNGNKLW